jgi:predicted nucleic acid-binding protein
MRFVVDSNRIIAALLKESAARKILLSDHSFVTVSFAVEEIAHHRSELLRKSGLAENDYDTILAMLFEHVLLLDDALLHPFLPKAQVIMGHIDTNDAHFIAAALCTPNDGIWSDDKHFLQQEAVKVWTTQMLLRLSR